MGAMDSKGRGELRVGQRIVRAYVYFYEQRYGPVPDKMELDHFICDNPICCNPDHVQPAQRSPNGARNQWHSKLQIELNDIPF